MERCSNRVLRLREEQVIAQRGQRDNVGVGETTTVGVDIEGVKN